MARPIRGSLTKKKILEEIQKKNLELKSLQRISKLQKKFTLGIPKRTTRLKLRKTIDKNAHKIVNPKDVKKIKIFSIDSIGRRREKLFFPAIPKGVKINPIKRRRR